MRTPALATAGLLLLLALPAATQTIHRCRATDGGTIYSDRPCRVFGAEPLPPLTIDEPAAPPVPDEAAPERADGESIPSAATGCPGADPGALVQRVTAALEARDINALAGMYDWAGAARSEARDVLRRLQRLLDQRAAVARLEAISWHWSVGEPAVPSMRISLLRDAPSAQPLATFRVVEQAGCFWLAD